MNKLKLTLLVVLALLLSTVAISTSPAQATPGSGAIWTTNSDCSQLTQDENHYAKGSWVYIHGENFDAGTYDWFIIGQPGNASDDPNIKVAQGTYEVDESGSFCFAAYQVNFDDGGEYKADFDGKKDNYRVNRDAASVSINVGACDDFTRSVSSRSVSLVLTGASLTINGNTYTSSTVISLAPGSYNYTWQALPGYTGSGSGSVNVPDCEPELLPASVTIEVAPCVDDESESRPYSANVSLTIVGATLVIDGSSYTSSQTISLAPGSYDYSWSALPGYSGSGSGELFIGECDDDDLPASVSIEIGICTVDPLRTTSTSVALNIVGASLEIGGNSYTSSQVISLAPGSYDYSWSALPGYSGSGSGSITIVGCEPEDLPASVTIEIGLCSEVVFRDSSTDVTLTIEGATLTLNGSTYTSSQTISLTPGSYDYSWTALPGYFGSGSGEFSIGDCSEKEASSVLIEIGNCTPDGQGGTYRPITLTITLASLTIDGNTYTESTVLNLIPGSYDYSWTGDDESSGEGTLDIVQSESCLPAVDPTPTPTSSPATGSSDSPVIYAIIGASALLISGISLVLWRKKLA